MKPWLTYAVITTLFWGVWGAFAEFPTRYGFPETLVYVVWALTMIPPAIYAMQRVHWKIALDAKSAFLGALIGFTGARVIEQTIREKLPAGFQRAEYLLDHGVVDMVTHRHELRATLSSLTHMLMKKPRPRSRALAAPATIEAVPVNTTEPAITSRSTCSGCRIA